MKTTAFALTLMLITTASPTTSVASPEQHALVRECITAVEANDIPAAKSAAEQIKQWRALFDMPLRREATKCLSAVYGEPWAYFDALGRFTSEKNATVERAEAKLRADRMEAVETLKARIRSEMAASMAAYDQKNEETVLLGTHLACQQLFESSEQAAMTNEACISSFRAFGHPDMPSKPVFTADYLEKRLGQQIREEVAKGLTAEQLSSICEADNLSACLALGIWPPKQ